MNDESTASAQCPRCHERRNYEEFFNETGSRRPYCNACTKEYQHERYLRRRVLRKRRAGPRLLHHDLTVVPGMLTKCIVCGQDNPRFLAIFEAGILCFNCGYAKPSEDETV